MTTEEKQGLLEDLPEDDIETGIVKQSRSLWRTVTRIIPHVLFIVIYTLGALSYVASTQRSTTTAIAPIDGLDLRIKSSKYTDFETSPFAGPPSPGLDKHWHDLLSTTAIRVSKAELQRSNQTSVVLPEGGGFMAWLGVYHELHCIKMLRQWNYRDHYHPNLTKEGEPHWTIHADHCLELLRTAALCRGDTTLTTFGWTDQPAPMLNTRLINHKCIDWDALKASVAPRVVGREEIARLVNPNL